MRIDRNVMKKLCRSLIWLFPCLFLIDDVLGFNGYQFTIAGRSIRIILFCISVAVLCVYSLYICYREKIALLPGVKGRVWLLSTLKPIDWLVMLFIVGNAVWATVIPLAVRGEMQYSLKDFSTVLVMVLYFPVMFLIRTGRLKLATLEKLLYALGILLALWHCVMYVGETVSPGFYAGYYDFIDVISFGTAVRTEVIFGFGITRVIQVTSLFLLVGIFQAIRYCLRGRYVHLIPLVLFTAAICITYTKSIWFGYALGLVVYLVPTCWERKLRKRSLLVLLAALITIAALNYTVFDNTILTRVLNTTRAQQDTVQIQEELNQMLEESKNTEEDVAGSAAERPPVTQEDIEKKQNELLDAKGTQMSNAIRAQQNAALLSKWKQSKWVGFGYGSYAPDCIRNEEHPFMYESTLPALIMKLGVLGCMIWVVFIVGATVCACTFFWKRQRSDVFWWLGLAISYALAVQTNPFLFTFTGYSILLYLMLAMQEKKNTGVK